MKVKQSAWMAAVVLFSCVFVPKLGYLAQEEQPVPTAQAPDPALEIKPIAWVTPTVTIRTPEQIDAFRQPVPAPESPAVPFRPTMGDAEYRSLKAAATSGINPRTSAASQVPLHGISGASAYTGGNRNDNSSVGEPFWFPPDSNGTVGSAQFVETVNNYLNVYSKAGVLLKHTSLTALMGSSTSTFDPRVLWDPNWSRWVVTADSFPVDSSHQYFWIAVSRTSSATGSWFVYFTNTNSFTGSGSFWDYPSLGLQQDSIIFTANVFGTSSFLGAYAFALSKAQAYNGHTQGFKVFGHLSATLQPPNVLGSDLNGFAWLAAAASGTIQMYAMENPSSPNNTFLFGPYTVTGVGGYSVPPSATQPSPCGGGTNALDTSDTRFVNASAQIGDRLYQVHSVNFGGPAVRYYVIRGLLGFAPAVAESGTFWATGTSSDWNASIAADSLGEIVVTWSSVDAGSSPYNAQVRYVGKQSGDPVISGAVGNPLITSGACLTGNYDSNFGLQRWGDYSRVSPDTTAQHFWIINEDIINANTWGTEFGNVNF
jgi:hypothetical protein